MDVFVGDMPDVKWLGGTKTERAFAAADRAIGAASAPPSPLDAIQRAESLMFGADPLPALPRAPR